MGEYRSGRTCRSRAKITENGKPYCGTHDPEKKRARRAKWNQALDMDHRARERAEKGRMRDAARLTLYPKLVAAMQETIDTAHPDMDAFDILLAAARTIEENANG